jgi:hypothetical protein
MNDTGWDEARDLKRENDQLLALLAEARARIADDYERIEGEWPLSKDQCAVWDDILARIDAKLAANR